MLTMSVEADEESYAVDMRHHSVVVSYVLQQLTLCVSYCLLHHFQSHDRELLNRTRDLPAHT